MMERGFLLAVPAAHSLSVIDGSVSPEAMALRQQIAEACNAWLLRSPSQDTRGNYARDLRQLQNRKVTHHTLRHTTAMHLLQSGVEVNVIRSWLGHVSITTTNRYIEIDLAMKAEALAACEVTSPSAGEAVDPRSPDILTWLE